MPDENSLKQETLDEWREHPVTRRILAVLRQAAEANRESQKSQMWASGQRDDVAFGHAQAQLQLIEDLTEASASDWNEWQRHFDGIQKLSEGDKGSV